MRSHKFSHVVNIATANSFMKVLNETVYFSYDFFFRLVCRRQRSEFIDIVTVTCVQTQIKHLSSLPSSLIYAMTMHWNLYEPDIPLKLCGKINRTSRRSTTMRQKQTTWANNNKKKKQKKKVGINNVLRWHINKNAYQLLSAPNKFAINIATDHQAI